MSLKCDECGELLHQLGGEFTTLVGPRTGDCGRPHDDNCLKRVYQCCNQHRKILSKRRACPCGWLGKTTCFCHTGSKLDKWPEDTEIIRRKYGK